MQTVGCVAQTSGRAAQPEVSVIHTAVVVMHERPVVSHEEPAALAKAVCVSLVRWSIARLGLPVARRNLAGASLFDDAVAVLNQLLESSVQGAAIRLVA